MNFIMKYIVSKQGMRVISTVLTIGGMALGHVASEMKDKIEREELKNDILNEIRNENKTESKNEG